MTTFNPNDSPDSTLPPEPVGPSAEAASPSQVLPGDDAASATPATPETPAAGAALVTTAEQDPQLNTLLDRLNDPDVEARCSAAKALGALGDQRAVKPLLMLLIRGPHWRVQREIIEALGTLGDPAAVEPLVNLAKQYYAASPIRVAAVQALGQLNDARAVDPLLALLGDSNLEISEAAAKALRQLGASPSQIAQERAVARQHHAREAAAAKNDEDGGKLMARGCIWAIGGLVLTGITYAIAAPGGTYYFFWGAILYGGYLFIKGMMKEGRS